MAFRSLAILGLLWIMAAPLHADWVLNPEHSLVSYVSIKNGSLAENNFFERVSGSVSAEGDAQVVIDLTSVETGVDIRNDRVRRLLFEVANFATATVTAKVPVNLANSPLGYRDRLDVGLRVTSHGETHSYPVMMEVIRISTESLVVHTVSPVLINAEDFGYSDGLKTLQKLAGLESIESAVPVSFSLLFEQR